jgi:hypothetical protein
MIAKFSSEPSELAVGLPLDYKMFLPIFNPQATADGSELLRND